MLLWYCGHRAITCNLLFRRKGGGEELVATEKVTCLDLFLPRNDKQGAEAVLIFFNENDDFHGPLVRHLGNKEHLHLFSWTISACSHQAPLLCPSSSAPQRTLPENLYEGGGHLLAAQGGSRRGTASLTPHGLAQRSANPAGNRGSGGSCQPSAFLHSPSVLSHSGWSPSTMRGAVGFLLRAHPRCPCIWAAYIWLLNTATKREDSQQILTFLTQRLCEYIFGKKNTNYNYGINENIAFIIIITTMKTPGLRCLVPSRNLSISFHFIISN